MLDLKGIGATGVKVPAIGLGTWQMGGTHAADYSRDRESMAAIEKAIDSGLSLVDTAERYGEGHCEELVGQAIKAFDRDRVFVVSKVGPEHLRHDDLVRAAKDSLKRLDTSRIDLYLIHAPNPHVPLAETMRAMEELVEHGLARFIGVSKFDVSLMEQAQACLSRNVLAANEIEYNLLSRGREKDVIPYCEEQSIAVIAYRPLARPAAGSGLPHGELLRGVGDRYGKTAAQVALNWLISMGPVFAIPKASNAGHIEENAAAMGWRLSAEDIASISSYYSVV
ncbi:MAG: aldo/keto reductase [Chloroflexi bacterium]|nr:aldo/keto reductase [Chloroflexota bacterium]